MYLTSIRRSPVRVTSNGYVRARACVCECFRIDQISIRAPVRVDRPRGIYVYDLPDLSILFLVFVHLPALSSTIRTSSLDCTATSRSAGLSRGLYYSQHVGRFESDARVAFYRASPSFHQRMICSEQSINSFNPFSVLCLSFLLHLGLTKSLRP